MDTTLHPEACQEEQHVQHMAARAAGIELDQRALDYYLRQAHVMRAQHTCSLVAAMVKAVGSGVATLTRLCREHYGNFVARQALEALDDRLLEDIGLHRFQIPQAVAGTLRSDGHRPGVPNRHASHREVKAAETDLPLAA